MVKRIAYNYANLQENQFTSSEILADTLNLQYHHVFCRRTYRVVLFPKYDKSPQATSHYLAWFVSDFGHFRNIIFLVFCLDVGSGSAIYKDFHAEKKSFAWMKKETISEAFLTIPPYYPSAILLIMYLTAVLFLIHIPGSLSPIKIVVDFMHIIFLFILLFITVFVVRLDKILRRAKNDLATFKSKITSGEYFYQENIDEIKSDYGSFTYNILSESFVTGRKSSQIDKSPDLEKEVTNRTNQINKKIDTHILQISKPLTSISLSPLLFGISFVVYIVVYTIVNVIQFGVNGFRLVVPLTIIFLLFIPINLLIALIADICKKQLIRTHKEDLVKNLSIVLSCKEQRRFG